MRHPVPISLKRIIARSLAEASGPQQAEEKLKARLRWSSKSRADLVESLTRDYDPGEAEAARRMRLI